MKPMDIGYIEQNGIAQKYLMSKLTLEEIEAFEVYLMDHPEDIEALELDSVFIDNRHAMRSANHTPPEQKLGFWQVFWNRPVYVSLSTAFVCVLVFKIVFMTPDESTNADNLVVSPTLVYVSHVRGNRQVADAQMDLNDQVGDVIIVVQDSFEKEEPYLVSMRYDDNSVFSQNIRYQANSDSELLVNLPASEQKSGLLTIVYFSENKPKDKRELTIKVDR